MKDNKKQTAKEYFMDLDIDLLIKELEKDISMLKNQLIVKVQNIQAVKNDVNIISIYDEQDYSYNSKILLQIKTTNDILTKAKDLKEHKHKTIKETEQREKETK